MTRVSLLSGHFINNDVLKKALGMSKCSDKDILATGYDKKGSSFFKELNGVFSFVLFDETDGTWYCCRDRFGGRGLYYAFDKDGNPVFSVTIKELLKLRNEPACFNVDMLEVYLSYSYMPGEETAIKGIWKPLPGYIYCFKNRSVKKERFFTPEYNIENHTEDEWKSIIAATLDEVFSAYGHNGTSMLSSGIDSSYICRKLSAQDTYTAAYDDADFSEAGYAEDFSKEIGARHHAVKITPEAYLNMVPEVMNALEQPSSDLSAEAVMMLFKEIKKDHDTCFSGEGADELFMGYYMNDALAVAPGRSLYDAGYIGTTAALTEDEKFRLLKNYDYGPAQKPMLDVKNEPGQKVTSDDENMPGQKVTSDDENMPGQKLMSDDENMSGQKLTSDDENMSDHELTSRKMEYTKEAYGLSAGEDNLSQAAMVDMLVWLNGNLLPEVYGLAGTVGLDIITPYLDNRLYDISLRIASEMKNDESMTKKIFRKAVSDVVGDEMARRPKRGFPVPLRNWIRRPDYVKRIKLAFTSDTAFHFFNTGELIAFYDEMLSNPDDIVSWRKIWCIYCFIVWYDKMISPYHPVQRWQVYDERFNRTEAWSKKDCPDAKFSYMRQAGCLVVSLSTMLCLYGIEKESDEELFNPRVFLKRMMDVRGFTPAADLNLDALQDIYPVKYVDEEKYSQERLAQLMAGGEMCLVRVNGSHDAYHFVVPTRIVDDDVEIIDSGWNFERLSCFEHKYSILRFVRTKRDEDGGKGMPPEERIISAAMSYIGVHESSCDANDVIFNTHYYGQPVYGPGYAWCVAFIWDMFRECGLSRLFFDGRRTAACIELCNWGRETGRLIDPDKGRRGDIALYDWYDTGRPVHAGIILGDFCKEHYRTIEGNTTNPMDTEDVRGRVMVQKRRFGGVFAIIRPDYDKYE